MDQLTKASILKAVAANCPDYKLVGSSLLVHTPVGDIVRAIVAKCPSGGGYFQVRLVVQPLFCPLNFISIIQDVRMLNVPGVAVDVLRTDINRTIWNYSESSKAELTQLAHRLSFTFSNLAQYENFILFQEACLNRWPKDTYNYERLAFAECIVGQLDKASVHLEQVAKLYAEFRLLDDGRREVDWSKAQRERCELVLKFITEKKLTELNEQFEVWRKYSMKFPLLHGQ